MLALACHPVHSLLPDDARIATGRLNTHREGVMSSFLRAILLVALVAAMGCRHRADVAGVVPSLPGNLIELDLAGTDGTTQTRSVAPGTVQVLLRNRLPTARYSVTAITNNIPISALDTTGLKSTIDKAAPADSAAKPPAACLAVDAATTNLRNAQEESKVPDLLRDLGTKLQGLKAADEAKCPTLRVTADSVQRATVLLVRNLPTVAAGQQMELTISRALEGSSDRESWRAIFTTGARGNWRVGFGYAGARYRGGGRPEKYFARDSTLRQTTPTGTRDSTVYIIAKQRNQDVWSDPIPAFFFSWMPASRELRNFSFGPTAGLSVDFTQPRLMGGFELTYNQNIMLSAGGIFIPVSRLRGTYSPDQIVLESLTDDQLHQDKYRLHPYVGLAYRFNSNPFRNP